MSRGRAPAVVLCLVSLGQVACGEAQPSVSDDEDAAIGLDARPRGEAPRVDAGGDSTDGAEPVLPTLELGTGFNQFAPLTCGDSLNIIQGPQGGFHLWAALRTHGLSSETTWSLVCTFERDGSRLAEARYVDRFVLASGDALDYPGIAVIFFDTEPEQHDALPGELSCHLEAPDSPEFDRPEVLERLQDKVEVVPQCCRR
jgi:hypothetical protein